MKRILLALGFIMSAIFSSIQAQTDYSNTITNPGFETGDALGWSWTGADGYAWLGPNTDGDATKEGTYVNGLWNASIEDPECYQTIKGLTPGNYQVSALVTVSTNRLTNQRLFATSGSTTKSMLYGSESHAAYSASNLSILATSETYSFGGYAESSAENGPFQLLSVVIPVSDDSLTIGIRVSGKSSTLGYDFSHTSNEDAGFFKFDHFTLIEVSDVATLNNISLSTGFLDIPFSPSTLTYTSTLAEGTQTVTPTVIASVAGVAITGTEAIDVSGGSGTSTITITALNGVNTKTYTIQYTVASSVTEGQQDKLYTNEFPLGDVTLLEGPFKHAQELNIETLLQYDVDRLLAPYRKEAGLSAKASSYTNWIGLDGHIGGHYLSGMAMNYAATSDTTCKRLMEYMVSELIACQDANAVKYPNWAVGYAGGVPSSNAVWSTFKTGSLSSFNTAWVPWYNLHKTYAGLRDAWLYGGSETAKTAFIDFCDWAIDITSGFSDAQMESMLDTEHGGMNEVFADAYQITGDDTYISAAKRFSHKAILTSMAAGVDNLDNMHANTQVPKAVGFQRIAEVTKDATYSKAAEFFWETVATTRSLALGGNSRKEYFPQASATKDYINDTEGPESCNTYNMLKLAEHLFRVDPQVKYVDYYERALYNHILSTQHPEHGGYVYFTPARPQHYRVYSAPNEAMWCCVGTGMENHGKYGEFIYTHNDDALYLNLFIASELNWKAKGVTILQETTFPEEEQTQITVSAEAPTDFTLMVRSPKWVADSQLKITVNDEVINIDIQSGNYIPVQRTWNNGDVVKIILPMHNTIEHLPNAMQYVAIMHGPVLLGAKTGTEDLSGLIADDSRWGHIASGELISLGDAPIIVNDQEEIPENIIPIDDSPLEFKANDLFVDANDTSLALEPFYKIHDARYMMYWMALSEDEYQEVLDSLETIEEEALKLEARTIDKVAPGEQQPEADHNLQSENSYTGNWTNEFWRDARDGGFISYTLLTDGKSDLSLMARYWGNEVGNRTFDILIDDEKLVTENIVGQWNKSEFVNVEYPIPNSMTTGKDILTVKFQAINSSNFAGGLFYVRLLGPEIDTSIDTPNSLKNSWNVYPQNNTIILTNLPDNAQVNVYDSTGRLLLSQKTTNNTELIPCTQKGFKLIQLISDGETSTKKIVL